MSKNSGRSPLFFIALLLFVGVLGCLGGCNDIPSQSQVTYSGPIMGTDYRISVIVPPETDLEALESAVLVAMQAVNQSMSTYIAESELNQLNRLSENKSFTLSPSLAQVLEEAIVISRLTQGAFDVTLAPAINIWGFGPNGRVTKRPTDEKLEEIRSSVGYQKINLVGDTVTKLAADISIDLSAIAKGYAVDKVAETLHGYAVTDFLVNIGGELRSSGQKLGGAKWQVGIEKPHVLGGIEEIAILDNKAIATSGDYRNYYVIDGEQFSHTIDPLTLTPVFHKLALVSVIADTAMRADALATALMAMGETKAQAFAKKHKLAAYMIVRGPQAGQYTNIVTKKFKAVLQ